MFALLAKIIGFFFLKKILNEAAAPKGPAGFIEIQWIFFLKALILVLGDGVNSNRIRASESEPII